MLFNTLEKLSVLFECFGCKENKEIKSFKFDSRLIEKGDVFIALKAERDGHHFIDAAIKNGAIAIIVEQLQENISIPQFKTANTWQALELLAEKSRLNFMGKTLAVTGSCGKTTIKQMLLHSLSNSYATEGNFNGLLGLPITLTHLKQNADYAILELGTDEIGNISKLTNLAKPDIAIVTSIGPAHLEMFKTISNIVTEKLSIAEGLNDNGVLVIPYEYKNKADHSKNILDFSEYNNQAYAYIDLIENHKVTAKIGEQSVVFDLEDTASHKLTNALIIFIVLEQLGFSLKDIATKVSSFKAPAGRGEQTELANSVTLFDESYNANPLSMKKAIESFKNLATKKKIAILGDMLELGADELLLHKQLANYLDDIDRIYTVGPLMKSLHSELENKGIIARHFSDYKEMLEYLPHKQFANCDILVKGSKGSKVSKAVEYFKGEI